MSVKERSSVETRVRDVLTNLMSCDEDDLVPPTRLKDDLAMDSLDLAEFWMTVEKEFGLDLEQEFDDVEQIETIQQVVAYVDKNRTK